MNLLRYAFDINIKNGPQDLEYNPHRKEAIGSPTEITFLVIKYLVHLWYEEVVGTNYIYCTFNLEWWNHKFFVGFVIDGWFALETRISIFDHLAVVIEVRETSLCEDVNTSEDLL